MRPRCRRTRASLFHGVTLNIVHFHRSRAGFRPRLRLRLNITSVLIWCLPFLSSAYAPAAAQPLDFTLNATPAFSLNLSGRWQIARDPQNVGKNEKWFERGPLNSAVAAEVPNPLERTFPGYDGVVWYWRLFDGGNLAHYDDVRIHFQGTDYYVEAWLNGQYLGCNKSALLPFAFDVTKVIRGGTNRFVVRLIDASYAKEVDGFQLGHVPTGRQHDNPMERDWRHWNYGGLLLPVSVQAFQRPWLADVIIRPDIKQSKIDIDLRVIAADTSVGPLELQTVVQPVFPHRGSVVVRKTLRPSLDSKGRVTISLVIPQAHLWNIWDSFLYELLLLPRYGARAGTTWRARFGMREVSILDGRIAVNGRPILQRSYLYHQIWPITLGAPHKDMARRDVELARRTNANMLRCFCKTPVPATVEAADELGMLLQTETLASCNLQRGDIEEARLKNITERTTLLYRNHPSILWGNVLNENVPRDDPMSHYPGWRVLGPYVLKEILPALHELDPTRPALADDPVWPDVPNIWEPGKPQPTLPFVGDHYYQFTGLEANEDSWLQVRGRVWGDPPKPGAPYLAITEWGQNSSPDWKELMRSYELSGVRKDAEDYEVYRKLLVMNRHWYEESGIEKQGFPTLENLETANREAVAQRYKEYFALYWGNTHSVGQGVTSLEDSSYELSGVVDIWRHPKPVVFDTITQLNRPQQINLWVRPSSIYRNGSLTFDATLVNEGRRLAPGDYTFVLRVLDGAKRVLLKREYPRQIRGDLIEYLATESFALDVRPGFYGVELAVGGGGHELKAEQPVEVFESRPGRLAMHSNVWVWEKESLLKDWLAKRGVMAREGGSAQVQPGDWMLVLDVRGGADEIERVQADVRRGAVAIILQPEKALAVPADPAVRPRDQNFAALLDPVFGGWKPTLRLTDWWGSPGMWGYARTALALRHHFLDGLPQAVALEAQPAYQRLAPLYTWVLTGCPKDVAIDRAVAESSLNVDIPYTVDLFSLPLGKGRLILTSLRIAPNLNVDPAADRILENIIRDAR